MIRESQWTYETSSGGNTGLGPISLSGGAFVLNNPSKHPFKYSYHAGGFGLGPGLRLPPRFRLPEIKLPRFISKDGTIAGTGATSDFRGDGVVFRLKDKELEVTDFAGMTLNIEVGGGVLVAGGGTAIFTGLKQSMIVPWLFNPGLFANVLFSTATAMMLLAGVSEGLVDGINQDSCSAPFRTRGRTRNSSVCALVPVIERGSYDRVTYIP